MWPFGVPLKQRYTVCVDFDGVLHSYTSPWINPHTIPDPAVAGALEWLCAMTKKFDVAVSSTRCKFWRGRRAMRRYLTNAYKALAADYETTPAWLRAHIAESAFADPWDDEVEFAIEHILRRVTFPKHKPAALVYLDDRAVRFTGPESWPTVDQIHKARPWNK